MAKWKINRSGPMWLMDDNGVLVGYRDSRGGEHLIPQTNGVWGDSDALTTPNTGGGGGASFNNLGTANSFVALGVTTDGAGANDGTMKDSAGTPVAAVKANVIPRTDTEAILLNTQGNAGEIASATDTNAIVKFNGALGGAVKFSPFGGSTRDNGALATIKPDADRITTTGTSARTILAGVFVGQTVKIIPASAFVLTGVATLRTPMEHTLRWNGTVWQHIYGQPIQATQVNGSTAIGKFRCIGCKFRCDRPRQHMLATRLPVVQVPYVWDMVRHLALLP